MNGEISAVGLFSGGLDSILATKILLMQGIDALPITFVTPFCPSPWGNQKKTFVENKDLGIKIKIARLGDDYIRMVQNPKFGYGKNMNPCIDCRIFMLQKAKEYMEKTKASFIYTGEVVGQRPMSQQKKTMEIIEREAGLEGFVVRPLSAKNLKITIPEKKGWINRDELLALRGRGRKPQLALSKQLGIKEYPWPAGGCMLTDPIFARRLRDAFNHSEDKEKYLRLLRYGRHFRLKNGVKVIVGRNEQENKILSNLADKKDILIEITGCGSPITLLQGGSKRDIDIAASICVRYSDCSAETALARVWTMTKDIKTIIARPIPDEIIKKYRV